MKEKIHEYDINASYKFDMRFIIEAKDEKEAEKIARQTLVKLCKDQLSDKNNIKLNITKSHIITREEREVLEKEGIIEPIVKKKKNEEKVDPNKKTVKRTNNKSKK